MNKISASELLNKVRDTKPLVHHITNWVTIYDCANMTRAFGALPVMAHAKEEAGEMAGISSAVVLNIGTLTPELIDSMIIAGKTANNNKIPIVLDAVGVGATTLRNEMAEKLLNELKIDVIKGNASEIAKLAGIDAKTRGVESTEVKEDLKEIGLLLAKRKEACVVITGKEDIVCYKNMIYVIKNGHEMMGKVVGTGCMATSVLGAFAACANDLGEGCASALACYGIAGEVAGNECGGPGSFKERFYDSVYNLDSKKIEELFKIETITK